MDKETKQEFKKVNKKIDDLVEVIGCFSNNIDKRFDGVDKRLDGVDKRLDGVDKRLDGVDKRFDGVDKRFDGVDERFNKVETDLAYIKNQMVTKDYLDDKLSDHRGDMVVMMRKEDVKLQTLAKILVKKKVISVNDLNKVIQMEPFAK